MKLPIALSNRHIHLSQADIDVLFGEGHELTHFKPLSQPGQFACEEKVDLVGPKGTIKIEEGCIISKRHIHMNPRDAEKYNMKEGTVSIKVKGERAGILENVDVEKFAYTEAVNNGKEWPGFKLVEGRRTRRYSSEEEVAERLLEAGYEETKIYSKSLLSLTKLEKELGKDEFEKIIGSLIEKPPGKPKLVPDEDKRIEIKNTAEIDFKEEM